MQIRQSGYMLITLMLMIALAAMALLAVLPDMLQQLKRDREEEMCHRGTAYIRAIQHFYKKFGRYPTRIEELEETNKMRFLRHRYTDPVNRDPATGKEREFKLLHMQDVSLNNGPVLGGVPGLAGMQGQAGGLLGQQGGINGPNGLQGALGQLQQGGLPSGLPQPGAAPQQNADEDEPGAQAGSGASTGGSNSASGNAPGGTPNSSTGPGAFGATQGTGTGLNGTVFGGGPILGVASLSKAKTIREFNKKNHYNEWLFIYDPTSDRGGLLVGPWETPQVKNIGGATPASQLTQGTQQPGGFGSPIGGSQFGGSQFGQQQSPQQPPQNPTQGPDQP
ncbi:MAG: hypothetical protein WBQ72_07870 [Terriglobales bacterium]